MNKLLICFFIITATYAQAQKYKAFKLNISLGYAQPAGTGLADGFLVAVEPKYAIGSHVGLGVRVETAVLVRGVTWGSDSRANSGNVSTRNSAALMATYLFGSIGESAVRPFLGAGGGLFMLSSAGNVHIQQSPTNMMPLFVADYTTIGGVLRGGVKVGHVLASIEYNAVPDKVYQIPGATIDFTSRSSYAGFRLGFDIGGGRR